MKRKKWFMCVVTTTSVWTAVAPVHFFILWNWLKPGAINATATLICGDILCDYSLTWKKKRWFLNYLLITISSKPTQTETCFFFLSCPLDACFSSFYPPSPLLCCIWYCWCCFSFFLPEKWIVALSRQGARGSGLSPSCCLSYLVHRSWLGLLWCQRRPPPQPPMEIDRVGVGPALPCHFHNQCPKSLKQRQEVSNISSLLK